MKQCPACNQQQVFTCSFHCANCGVDMDKFNAEKANQSGEAFKDAQGVWVLPAFKP